MSYYGGAQNHLRLGGVGRAGSLGRKYTSRWVDPTDDWRVEGRDVANFAWSMYHAVPILRALLEARDELTHGVSGLRFRSTWESEIDGRYSEAERQTQDAITEWIDSTWQAGATDPDGLLTRRQCARMDTLSRCLSGDVFKVRVTKQGRPGASAKHRTKWRLVDADRVRNPRGVDNWLEPKPGLTELPRGRVCFEGIEMDAETYQRTALWVDMTPPRAGMGYVPDSERKFQRIEWYDRRGEPNVIHDFRAERPGQIRGFPEVAPMLFRLLQMDGIGEAHVVGTRVKASYPIGIRSTDAEVAARYQASGAVIGPAMPHKPGSTFFLGEDGEMVFPNISYDGKEYKEFIEPSIRELAASWGIPWQYVLNHVEGVSMASGRIYSDRAQQTGERWQSEYVEGIAKKEDRSHLREAIFRGMIPSMDLDEACKGHYPPVRQPDFDPNKTAQRAELMLKHGISPETVHRVAYRTDFESETLRRKRNEDFLAEHGFAPPAVEEPAPVEHEDEDEDEPAAVTAGDDEDTDDADT